MVDNAYWRKRFSMLEQQQNNIGLQCYADIEKQYRRAQKELEGQITSWYQRLADNNNITMSEARKMLNSKELAEFKWDVNEYIKYGQENAVSGVWVKQLENASARYHISKLEALKMQTQQSLEVMFGNQLDSIDLAMRSIYSKGYYHTAFEIQKGIGVGWDFAKLDETQIAKVINKPWAADGKNFSERVWDDRKKLVNELNTELTQSIILGKNPQKVIERIAKKMNTSKVNAARLVMTEGAFFSSAAQKDCFAELNVEEFEVVATLDSHTSDICRDMDGKHFPMSQWEIGATAPPFHVRCRSTTCPYFDDEFSRMGKRAARGKDGKTYYVPSGMTYKEWEKSFVEKDYTTRTKEQFERVADKITSKLSNYSVNPSQWSGNINIDNELKKDNTFGVKEWSCDISVIDSADDGIIWHELLHSCSISNYDIQTYIKYANMEEASVEFLKKQICKEKNISCVSTYDDLTMILQSLNDRFDYGSDMDFAKELFNTPLPDRYMWLENKVDDSLRSEKASFEDYNEVLSFISILKGDEK